MKFYNRVSELEELASLHEQSASSGRMTVITGRRRVGKTILALESAKSAKHLYLFVSRKAEALLCQEYLEEIRRIGTPPVIGEIRNFRDIFTLLIELSRTERMTLIIDEFQEFFSINPAVYSEIQGIWDRNKATCKLNLICIGSVHSLMHRIFQDAKEPLFGRADRIIFLKPFSIAAMHEVLTDHGHRDIPSLFGSYAITGGLPKYLEMLAENKSLTHKKMLDFILKSHSPLLAEGKNLLVEEFGREYGTYFSILELIAVGKTARSEIESVLEIHSGAYLAKLEDEYALIAKHRPINAKPGGRLQKYYLRDNFLSFWFRFIYRNLSAIETGNFGYVREVIERDYASWSGKILERFFHDLYAASGKYNRIGSYWERGNKNEIDLVAVNDLRKELVIAEIKRDKSRISLPALQHKAERLLQEYQGYQVEYRALGLEDAVEFLPSGVNS
ncbi:MAG: ATP-binding protein [Trichloromonadaceae bacterium]